MSSKNNDKLTLASITKDELLDSCRCKLGQALIQNKLFDMSYYKFKEIVKLNKNSENVNNDYFFEKNKSDRYTSSVAVLFTADNFLVTAQRSYTFALTTFIHIINQTLKKFKNNRITIDTYRMEVKNALKIVNYFSSHDKNKIKCLEFKKKQSKIEQTFSLFPELRDEFNCLISQQNYQPNDIIFLGGHPQKNETMEETVLREIAEEANIQSCIDISLLGLLTIYDHRFNLFFKCNLFIIHVLDNKRSIETSFTPNDEIDVIKFTLITKYPVSPLEIIKNCLV